MEEPDPPSQRRSLRLANSMTKLKYTKSTNKNPIIIEDDNHVVQAPAVLEHVAEETDICDRADIVISDAHDDFEDTPARQILQQRRTELIKSMKSGASVEFLKKRKSSEGDTMAGGGARGGSVARGRGSSSTAGRGISYADQASLGRGTNGVARGRGSGNIARNRNPVAPDFSQGDRRNGVARGRGIKSRRGGIGCRDSSNDNYISTDDDFDFSSTDEENVDSSEQQARGSNTTQAPTHQSHRQIIVPYGMRFEDPSVGKEIVDIFKSMFTGCWPRWTDVPKVNRRLMWERFQATYQWDPSLDEKVYKNWNYIIKSRYSDIMSYARSDAINKATERGIHVGDDLTLIKPFFPEWIDEANWAAMIDNVWNTDKWKRGSNAGKRNRATLVDGQISVHVGGSLSFDHHRLRMEKERGGLVSEVEVFKNFYVKKKKSYSEEASVSESQEFVTQRAKKVLDVYTELVVEKYGEDNGHHPINIDRDLWETANGGIKKGRLFGVPSDSISARGMSSTATSNANHTSEPTSNQIQRLDDTEERVTRLEAESKQTNEKVAEILKILNERLPPPPN